MSEHPGTHAEHDERVAHLRAVLEQRLPRPSLAETAQRLDDAIARDQKWDTRISMGEKELWERAATTKGVTTSEFVRDVVNRAAEEAVAAA